MRALVWANSVGAAISGVLVPVVWIRPEILELVIWWLLPAMMVVFGLGVLSSRRLLLFRQPQRPPGSVAARGLVTGWWRDHSARLEGVPRWGVSLGLAGGMVAWLVCAAAVVAEMAGVPGPDLAVAFVAGPMFLLVGMAMIVAAAMAERDRRGRAADSS